MKFPRPLGGFLQPGITKAGRLSFAGMCNGRKVKVYSALRPGQVQLRLAVQSLSNQQWAFPEVIAYDHSLIVEAWIEGESVANSGLEKRKQAVAAVQSFFDSCWRSEQVVDLASGHSSAFCYFEDYLLKRLEIWCHLDVVARFVACWSDCYRKLSVAHLLSHADLSADNVFIEAATNRVMFIDNELLGVGKGWILDPLNSFLGDDFDVVKQSPVPINRGFVELTWALRKAGSAFDAGEPGRAVELMRTALARFEKGSVR
ncbi:hypothetical protein [Stutzerimonas kunmingensis]|uniref:hypothetical protein n=1 Tax=Stutzerimonas kunmingensis TaxID=1211807 RepID=UPI0028AFE4BB|nr:hypothetical protein [Stutzerimonas kunmingensis]